MREFRRPGGPGSGGHRGMGRNQGPQEFGQHHESGVSSSGPSSDSLGKSLHFPTSISQRRDLEQEKHKSLTLTQPFLAPHHLQSQPKLMPIQGFPHALSCPWRQGPCHSSQQSRVWHDKPSKATSSEVSPLPPPSFCRLLSWPLDHE